MYNISMANIAFIDILTTMNDLHGKHNSPFVFVCVVTDESGLKNKSKPLKTITIKMIPDEDILGNGIAYHGHTNATIESIAKSDKSWISMDEGLKKIYEVLNVLSKNGVYVVGHGINKFTLAVLNEHFQRVLKKNPVVFDYRFVIDTESLAKTTIDVRKCGNYSLNSLIAFLKSTGADNTDEYDMEHDAETETLSQNRISDMKYLLFRLMKSLGISGVEELSRFINSEHNIDVFQQGKYKGMRIEDVFNSDRQYFSWIMKNRKFYSEDKDLLRKVERMMNSEDV